MDQGMRQASAIDDADTAGSGEHGNPARLAPRARRGIAWTVPAGIAIVLAACAPAPAPAATATTAAPAAPTASAAATPDCPIDAFETFAERFGREIAFQELTTADPLIVERYDVEAEPEPRRITTEVPLDDVLWPVMPRLTPAGRESRIEATADGGMQITFTTPDTSDQQTYVFAKAPCWQLQRVVDESI